MAVPAANIAHMNGTKKARDLAVGVAGSKSLSFEAKPVVGGTVGGTNFGHVFGADLTLVTILFGEVRTAFERIKVAGVGNTHWRNVPVCYYGTCVACEDTGSDRA